jgi:hypothetical protein
MAIVSFSITKRFAFRDSTQDFSNVYTYSVVVTPNETEALNRIDELVTFEQSIMAGTISFVHGRAWLSGGSPSENVMIAQKALTGTGSLTTAANMDKERAWLVAWPAGLDSRGKPVFLRKWWHTAAPFAGVTVVASLLDNTVGLSSSNRALIANKANEITQIGTGNEYSLCAMSGRGTTGSPIAHKYLEHRQLGDMWRG